MQVDLSNQTEEAKGDISHYNFYKYYKGCDMECDLTIVINPQTSIILSF